MIYYEIPRYFKNRQNPGTLEKRYQFLGMGEIWKAGNTRVGHIVAIKEVKEPHSERVKQRARTWIGYCCYRLRFMNCVRLNSISIPKGPLYPFGVRLSC
jgi:hypothetical protein